MVKTIQMDLEEYEKDLNMRKEMGVCEALDSLRQLLVTKTPASKFFGVGRLDPRLLKCKLMIDILNELNFEAADIQLATMILNSPEVPEQPSQASEQPSKVPQEKPDWVDVVPLPNQ